MAFPSLSLFLRFSPFLIPIISHHFSCSCPLFGLFDMEFGDPQIAEKFENENTDLITSEIEELAKELNVEPKKLLSKVLDYRFYY